MRFFVVINLKAKFLSYVACISLYLFINAANGLGASDVRYKHPSLKLNWPMENVADEFIIQFKNYYWKHTRENYIKTAFIKNNVTTWTFLPRSNQSNAYPSDFEVISSSIPPATILGSHPAIKRILYQGTFLGKLKYAPSTNDTTDQNKFKMFHKRHSLGVLPTQVTDLLDVSALWSRGITGKGVKVAVFDTGLPERHPHFRNVKERTNWTNEKSLEDGVSHGTFVAGVIASSKECLGIAPDVELYIFRVFTNIQVSYTSWFLDAFNYAMFRKINILNLSIGGPDFMDQPFVDKVLELSASKIIMISAIGNDGPLYGTLNNPGDQSDVIGVGGINSEDLVARFSSRGMTTRELPRGYGRFKPDIVTYGSHVQGSDVRGGCRSLSGTSVASPVVAGSVALLLSGAPEKLNFVNQASIKQVLTEGAVKLQHNNIFEQGHGKLNVQKSMELLLTYTPKITLSPPNADYTDPYMWPYSSQPLHCGGMPSIINITIWNGVSVRGAITEEPVWYPNLDNNGGFLDIEINYSTILWPWSGWMALQISVNDKGCFYEGESDGYINLVIDTILHGNSQHKYTLHFPINVRVSPKPPRHRRILWDQYHNIQYPPGYIPRDNLKIKSDPLDWRGDHIHTNFRDMYNHLRNHGYYIDVLGKPYTCFDATDYGTLLIVDPEEEFFDEEIQKLQNDVFNFGLGVIVFADWYNTTVMRKMKFFDENTREWWMPDTGGANIPALNDLLYGFGISLSDIIAEGYFQLGEHKIYYGSGATLDAFPKDNNNIIISTQLNDQGSEIIHSTKNYLEFKQNTFPVIGLFQMQNDSRIRIGLPQKLVAVDFDEENADFTQNINIEHNPVLNKRVLLQSKLNEVEERFETEKVSNYFSYEYPNERKEGRVVIMGDSNCIDSTHAEKSCMWLLNALLEFTMNSHTASILKKMNNITLYKNSKVSYTYPRRLKSSKLYKFSKVIDYKHNLQKRKVERCD